MPLIMAGRNLWQNRAGEVFCWVVVVDRGGLFLGLTDHATCDLTASLSFSLSYSNNVITFIVFLDYLSGFYKNMPKFC